MSGLPEILQQYGVEKTLSEGEVLCRQGSESDGLYYLIEGCLGVYREEEGKLFPLSEIKPGELVGELGAATGEVRNATVKAEAVCQLIHVPVDNFRKATLQDPDLTATIIRLTSQRLAAADAERVTLGRSFRQATDRVQALNTEMDQLEELLRLREELSHTIVHDLRNPLGVLSAGMPLIQRALDGEISSGHAIKVIGTMERSVKRMQLLVDTLLDLARLEEGQMTIQALPLDTGVLMKEILSEEQTLAESSEVTLENRLPADLPPIMADRSILQRVLINILDNALKFTPAGGHVWIEAEPQGRHLQIAIVDTGPGIPPEERQRIFEKFTQVKGRTGKRRGSGLGLAFCQMAIEAHQGQIWVEGGPKEVGSRFVLTIPVVE